MGPFNSANKFEIEHILSSETKHYVSSTALPLCIRVFLIPDLNVLTVECQSGNKNLATDEVLGNLIDFDDLGKQLRTQELETIRAGSSERIYQWVHYLAGLHLNFSNQS